MLNEFFKAIVDVDGEPIVICDLKHTIIYMNPTAVTRYVKWGGRALVGKSLMDCHNPHSREVILSVLRDFRANPDLNKVHTFSKVKDGEDADIYMVALRNGQGELIGYYEKHESRIHDV